MKKRFIAIMLAALMAVCAVTISAMAADALAFTDSTGINTNHYSFTLIAAMTILPMCLRVRIKIKPKPLKKAKRQNSF